MTATNPRNSATSLRAVTPHATNDLPDGPCRGLYIGTGGDISVIAADDTAAVTLKNTFSGQFLSIKVKAVRASGTTATDIFACY